jgi:hypothetical protein
MNLNELTTHILRGRNNKEKSQETYKSQEKIGGGQKIGILNHDASQHKPQSYLPNFTGCHVGLPSSSQIFLYSVPDGDRTCQVLYYKGRQVLLRV